MDFQIITTLHYYGTEETRLITMRSQPDCYFVVDAVSKRVRTSYFMYCRFHLVLALWEATNIFRRNFFLCISESAVSSTCSKAMVFSILKKILWEIFNSWSHLTFFGVHKVYIVTNWRSWSHWNIFEMMHHCQRYLPSFSFDFHPVTVHCFLKRDMLKFQLLFLIQ